MPPMISQWNRIPNKSSKFAERQVPLTFHQAEVYPMVSSSNFSVCSLDRCKLTHRTVQLGGQWKSLKSLPRVPGTLTPAPGLVPFPLEVKGIHLKLPELEFYQDHISRKEIIILIKLNLVMSHKSLNLMSYLLLSQETMKAIYGVCLGSNDTYWKLQMSSGLYLLLTHIIPALWKRWTMNGGGKNWQTKPEY